MITVIVPSLLQPYLMNQSHLIFSVNTLRAVFAELIQQNPEVRRFIFDDALQLNSYMAIFIDGNRVYTDTELDSLLPPSATVRLLPAFAGG